MPESGAGQRPTPESVFHPWILWLGLFWGFAEATLFFDVFVRRKEPAAGKSIGPSGTVCFTCHVCQDPAGVPARWHLDIGPKSRKRHSLQSLLCAGEPLCRVAAVSHSQRCGTPGALCSLLAVRKRPGTCLPQTHQPQAYVSCGGARVPVDFGLCMVLERNLALGRFLKVRHQAPDERLEKLTLPPSRAKKNGN